jgi:nucleoside-diphosphate-sugar epimerase
VRAVVTGGAGFLGSHLVDELVARGWDVVVIDDLSSGVEENLAGAVASGKVEVLIADICGSWTVDGPVDLVLNFASPASPPRYLARPVQTLHTGSIGVQKVIDLAMRHGARLVQASTSEVYGDPLVHPQPEDYWGNVNPVGPRSVYDEAKRFAEALVTAHAGLGALDAGIVRIFNTYGPRLRPSDGRVVSNFISQALRGEPLTVYGTGAQTRSYCYVDDLVRGILAMAQRPGVLGPVNLGNPGEFTVARLAEVVAELTGVPLRTVHKDLPVDDPTRRCPDITRARELLGWQPTVELTEGIRRTIEWFRSAAPS